MRGGLEIEDPQSQAIVWHNGGTLGTLEHKSIAAVSNPEQSFSKVEIRMVGSRTAATESLSSATTNSIYKGESARSRVYMGVCLVPRPTDQLL